MLNLVCWQPTLTEHQVHVMRALFYHPDVNLQIVVGKAILDERKSQGWNIPSMEDLQIISLERKDWWKTGRDIILRKRDSIHVFNTMWGDRRFLFLILYALCTNARVGLISEPYSDIADGFHMDGSFFSGYFRKFIRPMTYRVAGVFLGERVYPIFAISAKAIEQFGKAGFNKMRIFPYGYFVPSDSTSSEAISSDANGLRLIYLGSFNRRKGIDKAISAIGKCMEKGIRVSLDLYGPGEYRKIISEKDISVKYCGLIPFGESQRVIRKYDLLILPSRFDGWGVVVNEAIQQGIPVLVSKRAGASALVKASGAGAIFDPDAPNSLIDIIESIARDRSVLNTWKIKSILYRDRLTPENAAKYLYDCLLHCEGGAPFPVCPWY